VAGVQTQDAEAFRELVRLTYIPLVRFARTILGSRDEAEDVVQDVFALLWDRSAQWHPLVDPAAYLFRAVRNHALNEVRRHERAVRRAQRADGPAAVRDPSDASPSVLEHIIDAEVQATHTRAIAAVLATCTERQRTVYDLRYSRGLSAAEIAHVLEITPKSAAKLVGRVTHLVVDRLREELKK
jgi:RNA polymerase sigma-70 factor (ECF subfamily)